MTLKVLGSSSKGNCYLLTDTRGNRLIIEAGIKPAEVMRALDWKPSEVVAVLCTHRHNDHAGHLKALATRGMQVYTTRDVIEHLGIGPNRIGYWPYPTVHEIQPEHGYQLRGGFRIYVLELQHDVPCVGFIIDHEEMGRLIFLTDTMSLDYVIPQDTAHVMIEANYSDAILEENIRDGRVLAGERKRLLASHMELETTKEVLRSNTLPRLDNVILLHLSDRNADPELFRVSVEKTTWRHTYVACPGLELRLGALPF